MLTNGCTMALSITRQLSPMVRSDPRGSGGLAVWTARCREAGECRDRLIRLWPQGLRDDNSQGRHWTPSVGAP